MGPEELCLDLAMDWIPGLTAYVAEACRRQAAAGRYWFRLPPTALVGGRQDDVWHLGRRLAEEGEVPLLTLDLTAPETIAALRPAPVGQIALPPSPVTAIAATGCANPIVLVSGADRTNPEISTALGSMIDTDTSERWPCAAIGGFLDLRGITWLFDVANEHSLHSALYGRLSVVPMRPADRQDTAALRAFAFLIAQMKDLDFLPDEVATVICRMTDIDEWDELARLKSPEFRHRVFNLLSAAQRDGRSWRSR